MNEKKLEGEELYVKPEMEIIEFPDNYALVTEGCGSCGDNPDPNEGPFMGEDW